MELNKLKERMNEYAESYKVMKEFDTWKNGFEDAIVILDRVLHEDLAERNDVEINKIHKKMKKIADKQPEVEK